MATEKDTPVCNVFEGNESWWSAKYTGTRGSMTRAHIKRHENMDPEYKKELSIKLADSQRNMSEVTSKLRSEALSKATTNYYRNLPQEEYTNRNKKNSEAQLKYINSLNPEQKKERERQQIQGQRNMSQESKEAKSLRLSISINNYLKNRTQEEISLQGERVSKGRLNMSQAAKDTRRDNIRESLKRYRDSLSPKDLEDLRRRTLEGQRKYRERLTPQEKEELRQLSSFRSKSAWDALTAEQKRERSLKNMEKSKGPNGAEVLLGMYLDFTEPGKWSYNGQGQKITILGKIPDFVNLENKLVIELFGNYHHLRDLLEEEEIKIIKFYKDQGWDCRIIWEDEAYELCLGIDLEELNKEVD